MDCVQPWLPLAPVMNASVPANETLPPHAARAWPLYLADYPTIAIFNKSATREIARRSIESCREWDDVCQDPRQVFANATDLAVCALYHNLTTAVNDTTKRTAAIQRTETVISTCLISHCAQETLCSSNSTTKCSTASLVSTDGHLSSQGVGRCWLEICSDFNLYVNSDIGGLGVRRSTGHSVSQLLTVLVDYLVSNADNDRNLSACILGASPYV